LIDIAQILILLPVLNKVCPNFWYFVHLRKYIAQSYFSVITVFAMLLQLRDVKWLYSLRFKRLFVSLFHLLTQIR